MKLIGSVSTDDDDTAAWPDRLPGDQRFLRRKGSAPPRAAVMASATHIDTDDDDLPHRQVGALTSSGSPSTPDTVSARITAYI